MEEVTVALHMFQRAQVTQRTGTESSQKEGEIEKGWAVTGSHKRLKAKKGGQNTFTSLRKLQKRLGGAYKPEGGGTIEEKGDKGGGGRLPRGVTRTGLVPGTEREMFVDEREEEGKEHRVGATVNVVEEPPEGVGGGNGGGESYLAIIRNHADHLLLLKGGKQGDVDV